MPPREIWVVGLDELKECMKREIDAFRAAMAPPFILEINLDREADCRALAESLVKKYGLEKMREISMRFFWMGAARIEWDEYRDIEPDLYVWQRVLEEIFKAKQHGRRTKRHEEEGP